jgi:pyridoxamine 5'-phosphate oxidase
MGCRPVPNPASRARVDPIARFARWFRAAERTRMPLPEATALATAARRGIPSVRFVLLKGADARGFVFFTNAASAKGRDLRSNPRAALAFHWHPLGRQVRIAGRVEEVSPAEADAYWATRPRASQLAALASRQSATLTSRAALKARWQRLRRRHRGRPVPRPAGWTGFRVVPRSIEFWTHAQHRLHHRELFVRTRQGWRRVLLQP